MMLQRDPYETKTPVFTHHLDTPKIMINDG